MPPFSFSFFPKGQTPTGRFGEQLLPPRNLIAFRISLNQTSLRKMEEEEPERSGPFDPLLSKTSFDSFFFASILVTQKLGYKLIVQTRRRRGRIREGKETTAGRI